MSSRPAALSLLVVMLARPGVTNSTSLVLSPSVTMTWQVDHGAGVADIRVTARIGDKDWVGVGFSDYGDIGGADMCLVTRDWRGQVDMTDVTVGEDSLVEVDEQQDCDRQDTSWCHVRHV